MQNDTTHNDAIARHPEPTPEQIDGAIDRIAADDAILRHMAGGMALIDAAMRPPEPKRPMKADDYINAIPRAADRVNARSALVTTLADMQARLFGAPKPGEPEPEPTPEENEQIVTRDGLNFRLHWGSGLYLREEMAGLLDALARLLACEHCGDLHGKMGESSVCHVCASLRPHEY